MAKTMLHKNIYVYMIPLERNYYLIFWPYGRKCKPVNYHIIYLDRSTPLGHRVCWLCKCYIKAQSTYYIYKGSVTNWFFSSFSNLFVPVYRSKTGSPFSYKLYFAIFVRTYNMTVILLCCSFGWIILDDIRVSMHNTNVKSWEAIYWYRLFAKKGLLR